MNGRGGEGRDVLSAAAGTTVLWYFLSHNSSFFPRDFLRKLFYNYATLFSPYFFIEGIDSFKYLKII